jgi:hypothetical protein
MRGLINRVGAIMLTVALAIIGYQNLRLAIVLLMVGAFVWLLTHERIWSSLQRGMHTTRAMIIAVILAVTVSAAGAMLLYRYFLLVPCPLTRVPVWGNSPAGCYSTVVTSDLESYKDKYRVGLVCGFLDARVDMKEDTKIIVSSLFSINENGVTIMAPWTGELAERAKTPGLQVWNQPFIIPKDINLSKITRLSDIEQLGGQLLGPLPPKL